jgi:hypothetical protein
LAYDFIACFGVPVITWVRERLGLIGLVAAATVMYSAWMTGGTFRFSEVERFPNHRMLASAFADGRLWIEEQPRVDVAHFEGKRYLYFGPVPAAIRTPLTMLGIRVPTGLMVALLCTAFCAVFLFCLRSLAPRDGPLIAAFTALCAGNGLMLFMSVLPSVHHESILWAGLFLLLGVLGVLDTWRRGPTVRRGLWVGIAAGLAAGCRVSYLPPGLVVIGAFCVAAYGARRSQRFLLVTAAAVAPLLTVGALLAAYNVARFGSPTEFGVNHLTSNYQDYIREGNFWRLDHVPYNLWDNLCRLPGLRGDLPYLESGITLQEVSQKSATPSEPFRLIHVNELVTSVFIVIPALLLMIPAFRRPPDNEARRPVFLLAILVAVQIGVLSLTFASTARYQFDFVPYMMLVAFIGATRLRARWKEADRFVIALIVISLVMGLYLPLNAIEKYEPFVGYRSPLLDLLR